MKLFGCYTGTSDWNPNGNDPAKNANWEAALKSFGNNVGRAVNCANVFPSWGSMNDWAVNTRDIIAKGIAKSSFGTSFVPVVGLKMLSKVDGYGWNDVKCYNDVAAGKWDSMWRGVVQALASQGFKYSIVRIAYEYNGSFMEDFMGWDGASQTAWKNGFTHAAQTLKDEAGKQGIRVDVCLNPNVMTGCPDVAGNIPDPKCWDVFGLDIYNQFWGEGDSTNADVRRAFWDNPKGGWGMQAHIALAKTLGKPIFLPECGSGLSSNGAAHGMINDPAFWPWLAGAIKSMRSQGVPYWGMCAWDIQPGDGSWRFADGTQPQCLSDFKANIDTFIGDDVFGSAATTSSAQAATVAAIKAQTVLPEINLGTINADTLKLMMSEDAYQGDAQFIVSVDGKQIGGAQVVKAVHSANQTQPFVIQGSFSSGTHTVVVTFTNDAWGGTPQTDRNLWVDGATLNGIAIANSGFQLQSNGSKSFTFQK